MNPLYPLVANRAVQRCEYCHAPEGIFNFAFQVEHIEPQSRGGSDDATNLALACNSCNVFKSDAITGWDEETGEAVRLFHPRTDSWADHFQVDTLSAEITGRTPVGRATVRRLQMNRPRQIAARLRWMVLGLFP